MTEQKRDLASALSRQKQQPAKPAADIFITQAPAAQPSISAPPPKEATRRTTFDLPDSLHMAYKMRSVATRVNMVDLVIEAMRQYQGEWE